MTKPIRLTKTKLARLDHALAFDDILYEKFRRLNAALDERYRKLYQAVQVVQVLQQKNTYPRGRLLVSLRILEMHRTEQGTQVIVAAE